MADVWLGVFVVKISSSQWKRKPLSWSHRHCVFFHTDVDPDRHRLYFPCAMCANLGLYHRNSVYAIAIEQVGAPVAIEQVGTPVAIEQIGTPVAIARWNCIFPSMEWFFYCQLLRKHITSSTECGDHSQKPRWKSFLYHWLLSTQVSEMITESLEWEPAWITVCYKYFKIKLDQVGWNWRSVCLALECLDSLSEEDFEGHAMTAETDIDLGFSPYLIVQHCSMVGPETKMRIEEF